MQSRTFAMGKRQPLRKMTDEEVTLVVKEIKRINADESVFVIDKDKIRKTLYDEVSDKVYIGSNVLPDNDNPDNMTDVLTIACVLTHEYYGHRSMRDKYINETEDSSMTPIDEFNASFLVYKNTPNLTDEERMMLLEHAYEIAKDGNLTKEIEICKNVKKNLYENK